ncbi:MAG: hypothetical protein HY834_08890 [Devosia nanyangense]|uniref:Tip attachment protein J HDII-ins2 domain-containing protein n=1 Tax=Devosia nanyangense TaxID=1228055 RepID=A0A933L2E6_9HYPH|nr:hypothetical protein [Devosia nanyangense]
MNAIVKTSGDSEIIPPGMSITLVLVLHPIRLEREVVAAPAGLTIAELVEFGRSRATTRIACRHRAWLNGHEVLPDYWRCVRPKPGTTLIVRAVAADGGDIGSLLKAAVAIGGALAGTVNPLLGAAITVGGSLLVNMLFPPASSKLASKAVSTAYALGGSSNAATPYGTISSVEGKTRVYPKQGSKWFTEFHGGDQYLIGLLNLCYGPVDISAIKIGETPIENFDDVEIELREGYADDDPITLYPADVAQTDLALALTEAAGWLERTTAADADVLSVDVVAAGGIVKVDSSGANKNYTVSLRAEYSLTSVTNWQLLGTLDLTARSTKAIRKTLRKTVARGDYKVRFKKTSTDYTGSLHVTEDVVWTALRSTTNEDPISFPLPLAKLAIRIKASSQLNGGLDTLNAICQSKVTSWSAEANAWVPDTISNAPADLFRHVAQGPANARAAADSRVDLETLTRWAAFCAARGYCFNMEYDARTSVYEALCDIAAAGRATVIDINGKWSVAWDDPDAPIVQHFTPRNSWGFSGSRQYRSNPPHGFRCRFVNETTGYIQDERIVYDDGYDENNATLFEQLEFPRQTDPDLVWKHARYHIAQPRLRPETYSLNVDDIEAIVATRGDRVRASHDVTMWGLGSGRVKAIDGLLVTLDEPVTMEVAKAYSIRFRLADNSSVVSPVITDDGEQTVVELVAAPETPPVAGDLFMFGETDEESVVLRLLSVTPLGDGSARVTMVDDAPEIALADSGAIPAFDSHITVPTDPATAAPVNLVVRETLEGVDGDLISGAVASWETLAGSTPVAFDVQYQDTDGDGIWRDAGRVTAPEKSAEIERLSVGPWAFQVRSVFADGTFSNWTRTDAVLTGLAGVAVPDVVDLRLTYDDKTAALTWSEVTAGIWPVRYHIRQGASWDGGLDFPGGDVAQTRWKTYGDGLYWVAAYITPAPGVIKYGAAASILVDGSVLVENVLAEFDEAAGGWTGTVSGAGALSGGNFVTTEAETLAYYEPISPAHVVDCGYARATRLNAWVKAVGVPVEQDIRAIADIRAETDLLSSASSRFVEAWVEVSIGQDGENDAFAPADIYAPADVFTAGVNWGAWQKFAPGVYVGRWFRFRLVLRSLDGTIIATATAFYYSVDVPDRVDHLVGYALAGAGATFTFAPDATAVATPFKGGPNGAAVPRISVQVLNSIAGDDVQVTAKTASQVTIQVVNAGVGVARTIDAEFQGW